jgi:hypothetical protein
MHSAQQRSSVAPETIFTMAIGGLLLAYGLVALLLGGNDLGAEFPDGTVGGETWLGIEGNGWTNLLFMAGGVLLIAGSPRRTAARTVALVAGLVLGAASVIAIADGNDVLGIFAANGGTMAAWGFAAVALILVALMPRRPEPDDDPDWALRDDQPAARFGRGGTERTTVDRTPAGRTRR